MTTSTTGPGSTMQEVLEAFPGARRVLFRKYHIGGCASCGFRPEETLAGLCARNGNLPVQEVLAHIEASHQEDLKLLIESRDLADELKAPNAPRLLDLRPREEWEAARIPGSGLLTEEQVQEMMNSWDRQESVVFVDHTGREAPDAAAYFAGHGFVRVRALRAELMRGPKEVDPSVPRYRLE